MGYWLFVKRGSHAVCVEQIKQKKWILNNRTSNRLRLEKGDKVVFYIAGSHRKKIIANAEISSHLKKESEILSIGIYKIKIWKNPFSIHEIIPRLDFIKNKKRWGLYLQGGIINLSKHDYDIIIKNKSTFKKLK